MPMLCTEARLRRQTWCCNTRHGLQRMRISSDSQSTLENMSLGIVRIRKTDDLVVREALKHGSSHVQQSKQLDASSVGSLKPIPPQR